VLAKEENLGNIVTVFPDDNKKYLSTDLSKPIDNNEKFISNQVEILDYKFV
jgi:cysteine synthase A